MTQAELLTTLRNNLARFEAISHDDLVTIACLVGRELTPDEANSLHRLGELLVQMAWWGRMQAARNDDGAH